MTVREDGVVVFRGVFWGLFLSILIGGAIFALGLLAEVVINALAKGATR